MIELITRYYYRLYALIALRNANCAVIRSGVNYQYLLWNPCLGNNRVQKSRKLIFRIQSWDNEANPAHLPRPMALKVRKKMRRSSGMLACLT